MENNNSKDNNQTNVSELYSAKETENVKDIRELQKELDNIEKEEMSSSQQTQTAFSQESSDEVSEQVETRLQKQEIEKQEKIETQQKEEIQHKEPSKTTNKGFKGSKPTKPNAPSRNIKLGGRTRAQLRYRKDQLAKGVQKVKNVPKDIKNKVEKIKNTPANVKKKFNDTKEKFTGTAKAIKDAKNNIAEAAKGGKGAAAAAAAKEIGKRLGGEKGQAIAKKIGAVAKGMEAFNKLKRAFETAQKVVQWIIAHIKPIAIVSLCVVVAATVILVGNSLIQVIGPSPHYYCDLLADKDIKKTATYKQYCSGHGGGYSLEELEGHYFKQCGPNGTGSGAGCAFCSMGNLYMRYFSVYDENFFDYLWDETGQYNQNYQLTSNVPWGGNTATNIRHIINAGSTQSSSQMGTPSAWKYVPITDTSDTGNYIIDQSLELTDQGSTFCANIHTGNSITIGDITGTVQNADQEIRDGKTIAELLEEHPCGLYVHNGQHAIVVTRYEDNKWYIIDPAGGPFEIELQQSHTGAHCHHCGDDLDDFLRVMNCPYGTNSDPHVNYILEDDGSAGGF